MSLDPVNRLYEELDLQVRDTGRLDLELVRKALRLVMESHFNAVQKTSDRVVVLTALIEPYHEICQASLHRAAANWRETDARELGWLAGEVFRLRPAFLLRPSEDLKRIWALELLKAARNDSAGEERTTRWAFFQGFLQGLWNTGRPEWIQKESPTSIPAATLSAA